MKMKKTLEELLKPIKYVDEQILRQYTKIGKRINIDEGRKKYFVGMGLWFTHVFLSAAYGPQLIGFKAELIPRILLNIQDFSYNLNGIIGIIEDEVDSETRAINPFINFHKKFNSIVRLPTFAAGVGLIGKFGTDLFNYIMNGEPIDSHRYNYLMYGVGLLSLASSMYIKETNPKLLQKEPLWKKAYGWLKEKASSLVPQPLPQPVPVKAYSTLEDYL